MYAFKMPSSQASSTGYLNVSMSGNSPTLSKTQMKSNSISSSDSQSTNSTSGSVVRRKHDSISIQSDSNSKQSSASNQLLTRNDGSTNETKSPVCEIPEDDRKSVLNMVHIFSNQNISSLGQLQKEENNQSKQSKNSTKEKAKLNISDTKIKSMYTNKQKQIDHNKVTTQVESKKPNAAELDRSISNSVGSDTPIVLSAIKTIEKTTKSQLAVSKSASLDTSKRFSAIKAREKAAKTQLNVSNSASLETPDSESLNTPSVLSAIKNLEKTTKSQLEVSNSASLDSSNSESLDKPRVLSAIKNLEKTTKAQLDVSTSASLDTSKRFSAIKNVEKTTKTQLEVSNSASLDSSDSETPRVLSAIKNLEKTTKTQLEVSNSASLDTSKRFSGMKKIEQNTKILAGVSNSTSLNTPNVLSAIKTLEAGQNVVSKRVTSNNKSNTASKSNGISQPRKKSFASSQTNKSKSSLFKRVASAFVTLQEEIKEAKETTPSESMTSQTTTDRVNFSETITPTGTVGAITTNDPEVDETYEILPSPETSVGPVHLYNNVPSQGKTSGTIPSYINFPIDLEKGSVAVMLFHQIDTDLVKEGIKENVQSLEEVGGQILALNPQFCILPEIDTAALFIYFTTAQFARTWLDHVRAHDRHLYDLCWVMVGENSQNRGRPAPLSEYKALSVTLMKRRRLGLHISASDTDQFRKLTDEVVAPMKEKHGGRTLVSAREVTFVSGDWSSLEVEGGELSFVVTQWPNLVDNFRKYRLSFNANEDLNRFCGLHEKMFSKILTAEFDIGEVDSFYTD